MENNPYRTANTAPNHLAQSEKPKTGFFKKLFIGLGAIFALLIVLMIFAAVSTNSTKTKFEGKAQPFIKAFLNDQNPWDYSKAKPFISSAWLDTSTDEDNKMLFNYFIKLGALTSIDDVVWSGCTNYASTQGSVERCEYKVAATYENGEAAIHIGLSIESEQLKMIQLNVNSNAFLQ